MKHGFQNHEGEKYGLRLHHHLLHLTTCFFCSFIKTKLCLLAQCQTSNKFSNTAYIERPLSLNFLPLFVQFGRDSYTIIPQPNIDFLCFFIFLVFSSFFPFQSKLCGLCSSFFFFLPFLFLVRFVLRSQKASQHLKNQDLWPIPQPYRLLKLASIYGDEGFCVQPTSAAAAASSGGEHVKFDFCIW